MLKSAFYSVQRPKYSKNRMRRLDCCCDRGWQQEYGNGVKTDTLTCSSAMNIFLNSCIAYSRSQSRYSEYMVRATCYSLHTDYTYTWGIFASLRFPNSSTGRLVTFRRDGEFPHGFTGKDQEFQLDFPGKP
jgi:hypothetical protein